MTECGEGALQTRGTCWFFSIINGFLLSEAGQKILFDHLEKFYKSLSPQEKAQFDDGIPAPCVKSLIKAKRIYFYKFLDQYLCFRSGPRSISVKAGKSANILGAASLAGTVAKAHAGSQGAFPQEELPKVLKHLGITDYLIANQYGHMPSTVERKRPHFVVAVNPKTVRMDRVPYFRPKTYSKMCCSVTIGNSNASNKEKHKFHAITGYVCNGKGYLFDSNQRKPFSCNWWVWNDLKRVVDNEVGTFYSFFKDGQINYMSYNFVIFSKNEYIDSIKPVCRLKYKKTKTLAHMSAVNIKNVSTSVFNPAEIAALKRARARKAGAVRTSTSVSPGNFRMVPASPEDAFTKAKKLLSSAPTKTARMRFYSQVWKTVLMHERKVLMHFRDTGVWVSRNYFKNQPAKPKPVSPPKPKANSPATIRRKQVVSGFKTYWQALTPNNHKTIRNYIASAKTPVKAYQVWTNSLKNINSIKTAKARAEWLKAKKANFKSENIKNLKNYIKSKDQANRNRRASKKST